MQILYVGAKGFFMSERRDSLCRSEGMCQLRSKCMQVIENTSKTKNVRRDDA